MATVKELIKQAESRLDDSNKDVNVAKVLFYHLANKEPHELYLMYDEEVDKDLEKQFLMGMEEYYNGRPIQYIKGVETFFGRDFKVNENVLIPRYETEELVENVLYRIDDYFSGYKNITLCDVGTGSGAIAISLALEEPKLKVYATDISDLALTVAKENANNLKADVEFLAGDMLQPLIEKNLKVDIFVSNPPYIPQEQEIEAVVKDNEPHVALFGGNDGLYFYRKIFEGVNWNELTVSQRAGTALVGSIESGLKEVIPDTELFQSGAKVADQLSSFAKWGGTVLTVGSNLLENIEEFKGQDGKFERLVNETMIESTVDIALDVAAAAGVTAAAAALGITSAPAVAVGAAAVGVTWAANGVCKWATGGRDIGEVAADLICDSQEFIRSREYTWVRWALV